MLQIAVAKHTLTSCADTSREQCDECKREYTSLVLLSHQYL